MITKKDYMKVIAEFEFLKFFPTEKEKLRTNYDALGYAGITEPEDLFKAFRIWVKDHDVFPSHIDLKKCLSPVFIEYSASLVMADHKKGTKLHFIKEWILKNTSIFVRPKLDSFDQSQLTVKQNAEWEKQEIISGNIAMKQFRDKFKYEPDEYEKLICGQMSIDLIEEEDRSDSYGINFKQFNKIEKGE